jgi:hypothetical protein
VRRSSSDIPPHTPASSPVCSAPPQTHVDHITAPAHLFRFVDLPQRRPGVADREKQLRVLIHTRATEPPVHGTHHPACRSLPISRAAPGTNLVLRATYVVTASTYLFTLPAGVLPYLVAAKPPGAGLTASHSARASGWRRGRWPLHPPPSGLYRSRIACTGRRLVVHRSCPHALSLHLLGPDDVGVPGIERQCVEQRLPPATQILRTTSFHNANLLHLAPPRAQCVMTVRS